MNTWEISQITGIRHANIKRSIDSNPSLKSRTLLSLLIKNRKIIIYELSYTQLRETPYIIAIDLDEAKKRIKELEEKLKFEKEVLNDEEREQNYKETIKQKDERINQIEKVNQELIKHNKALDDRIAFLEDNDKTIALENCEKLVGMFQVENKNLKNKVRYFESII